MLYYQFQRLGLWFGGRSRENYASSREPSAQNSACILLCARQRIEPLNPESSVFVEAAIYAAKASMREANQTSPTLNRADHTPCNKGTLVTLGVDIQGYTGLRAHDKRILGTSIKK